LKKPGQLRLGGLVYVDRGARRFSRIYSKSSKNNDFRARKLVQIGAMLHFSPEIVPPRRAAARPRHAVRRELARTHGLPRFGTERRLSDSSMTLAYDIGMIRVNSILRGSLVKRPADLPVSEIDA